MKEIKELTGLYSLTKTIGVELKPVGKTQELIEAKKLIEQDDQRAEDYKIVKDIIDRYHKDFIDKCLNCVKIKKDDLEKYVSLAENSNRDAEDFDNIKTKMRNQITESFKKNPLFVGLFKKELITNYLPNFVSEEERVVVNKFSKFTTYFDAFNDNRKNLYSGDAKSGTIAYRLIHENLPMFLDNIASFNKISETGVNKYFSDIENEFTAILYEMHLSDLFQIDYFNNTLTQKKIDNYNYIVGAVNKAVNLYKQQHKTVRVPLLKTLHKMILSERVTPSWLPERFESDEEMLTAIKETYESLKDVLVGGNDDSLRNLLLNIDNFDLEHIYIANDSGLTSISQQIFGYYDTYTLAIKDQLQRENPATKKQRENPATKKQRENPNLNDDCIDKLYKKEGSFSIAYLNRLVDTKEHITINEYYRLLGSYWREEGKRKDDFFKQIDGAYSDMLYLFSTEHGEIAQSDSDTAVVQQLLEAYKGLQRFIKPLLGHGDEADKDNEFDAKLRKVWDELNIITPLYDKVRNWLSRKIYNPEKIKLYFENNGKLLSGWSDSQTEKDNGTQYGGYIFRKKNEIGEYDFYLGISTDAKLFRRDETICYEDGMYERFDYYHLKPTTLLGKSYIGNYGEDSNAVLSAFKNAVTKLHLEKKLVPKDNEKVPTYLKRLKQKYANFYQILMNDVNVVDAYKSMKQHILATLASLIRVPAAIELAAQTDLDIDELIDEIMNLPSESFGYFPVATAAIEEANKREKKPLFLFKMSNKDLSYAAKSSEGLRKSRGTENLHTMYLKALLGMTQNVFSIGSGMVFFRHKTKGLAETTARHKANEFVANKNKLNDKKKSIFAYEIVKNKRFTVDKYLFKLSVKLNYSQPNNNKIDVNSEVREIISNGGIKHIIGIDRGERNLLYLSLIDLKGNIVMQKSLNILKDDHNAKGTDYKGLLTEREGERQDARRNWKKIANIKDLKRGYLSQVVHIISKMLVEYNAIVVLEDLNPGFIRGRQKIERNVYEQFERMLIDKLNFYVDKHKDINEVGGLLHAFQLTSEFKKFKKSEYQNGCLFYIPAWKTSKIDPATGFANLLDTRYTNADKALEFFRKFDAIRYNEEKDWFEFEFDYDKFTQKAHGTRTKWILCTHGKRLRFKRNSTRVQEVVVLTDEFKKILGEAGIDIHVNLKEAICNLEGKKNLEPLMQFMKLLLQLRNSKAGTDEDYILSPVADENGIFYDSRSCGEQLPENADANGAYNIARKGLMLIRQIKEAKELDKVKFDISNKAWLNFAQQKPYKNG
ncbi:type V CRISPR-associated protein Cas12a/Cpf1 [Segatella copri]|uniref:type V CRISPR-associated protein Cas12a/Cpf1 n=1 Tax=Segatella copri TaxID=165179 RepID=UPI001C47923C|nr:type V CRISPR-associated protein Cas12a/Cpf1 [Segatella copri]MBW0045765.1 type V CRISPR-associated protein Cas12a/Cpf1 [Segatella copri]